MDAAIRLLLNDGRTIPKGTLLVYLARPNSDAYITEEWSEVPEDEYDWGYVLPAIFFPVLGEGLFYAGDGTPKVVLASEILTDPGTNGTGYVLFKSISVDMQTGKLAVYHPSTDSSILNKAKKVLRIT